MKPTVEGLTEQFTRLIGPEAFAKAEATIAAAKAAAEVAAKAAAEKAAAAAAAAKAAAEKAAAEKASASAAANAEPGKTPVVATPAATGAQPSGGPAKAETTNSPVAAVVAAAKPGSATPVTTTAPAAPAPRTAVPAPAVTRPAVAAAPAAPRPAAPVPTAATAVAPAPVPTLPVQVVSHAAKGYNFDAMVAPTQVVEAARLLDQAGFGIDTITGVDWMAQNEMEVVYDYFHPVEPLRVVVRTRVPRATPDVPTITAVFPGANWHERETHDFFGIRFTGHPNLKPFLLPEDADFHPLRKDYQP